MFFVDKCVLQCIRKAYPVGCRVELVSMNDGQAPPPGTRGTVYCVDDAGTIHVKWDNGGRLGVVYKEDVCRRIDREDG